MAVLFSEGEAGAGGREEGRGRDKERRGRGGCEGAAEWGREEVRAVGIGGGRRPRHAADTTCHPFHEEQAQWAGRRGEARRTARPRPTSPCPGQDPHEDGPTSGGAAWSWAGAGGLGVVWAGWVRVVTGRRRGRQKGRAAGEGAEATVEWEGTAHAPKRGTTQGHRHSRVPETGSVVMRVRKGRGGQDRVIEGKCQRGEGDAERCRYKHDGR